METYRSLAFALISAALAVAVFLYWRYVWFFRNPVRSVPAESGILAPADGAVVYVKKVEPHQEIISVKAGVSARLVDIMHEEAGSPKLLIGIFMSPFDVHYNRAPLTGTIDFIRHYPGRGPNIHMGNMHLRLLLRRKPYYKNSVHILQNERTVTRITGEFNGSSIPCYVVQIAARSVDGIDSYFQPGQTVERGSIFGMIRIGSQVDVVLPWIDESRIRVRPGDRVRAGESILLC
jgi:phosphatidylserine decarboxylase